jgi:predicted alpha/beta-fold hydrolase
VDDLIYYLGILSERSKMSTTLDDSENDRKPIFLSGFSLGANVVLKALGQIGLEAVEKYGVVGAAVSGAPFDTERSYLQLYRDPVSRLVYVDSLLKKMKERAKEMIKVYYNGDVESAAFDFVASMKASTIYEFENACVAPLFSFDGYLDYYRKTSCGYYLDRICVPTLIVNAKDDPFFDSTYVPWDKVYGGESGEQGFDEGGGHAPIKIVMTEHGGHLGFLFHQTNEGKEDDENQEKSSWVSEELARFIVHAHDETISLQMRPDEKSGIMPVL